MAAGPSGGQRGLRAYWTGEGDRLQQERQEGLGLVISGHETAYGMGAPAGDGLCLEVAAVVAVQQRDKRDGWRCMAAAAGGVA